jgi:hypothetical protein
MGNKRKRERTIRFKIIVWYLCFSGISNKANFNGQHHTYIKRSIVTCVEQNVRISLHF